MASDAGPNPTHTKSCSSSCGVYRRCDRFSKAGKWLSSNALAAKPVKASWTAGARSSESVMGTECGFIASGSFREFSLRSL